MNIASRRTRGSRQNHRHAYRQIDQTLKGNPEETPLYQMFVFLDGPDGCRLVFAYRESGARAADCEALHFYFDAVGTETGVH